MMSDAVLQILLILAYLAIGLIAVTFPIYAICVTFLPRERWESDKARKKRIEKLQAKISELTVKLKGEKGASERVAQIKEEIERYETELKGTELRVDCLTAKGAVGTPVTYLTLALLTVGIAIYSFSLESLEGVVAFGFISSLCSAMAVRRLYKTITAVEYAALRKARTIEFNIYFEGGGKSREVKLGKKTSLNILWGSEEETVEKVRAMFFIHPELKLVSTDAKSVLQSATMDYPNYTAAEISCDIIHQDSFGGVSITILPSKTGKYEIPVVIKAPEITEYETVLVVHVIE